MLNLLFPAFLVFGYLFHAVSVEDFFGIQHIVDIYISYRFHSVCVCHFIQFASLYFERVRAVLKPCLTYALHPSL